MAHDNKDCKSCKRYQGDCGYHFMDSDGHIVWDIPREGACDKYGDCSFFEEPGATHILKCLPLYFNEVKEHRKRFELRKDDRDYKVGDKIILKEWDGEEYTGREIPKIKIQYILRDCPEYGLKEGYCILGF